MAKDIIKDFEDQLGKADTIEGTKAIALLVIAALVATRTDLVTSQEKATDFEKQLNSAKSALETEKQAHTATKTESLSIISGLKEKLELANANVNSEFPVIGHKGRKFQVTLPTFQLPKDPTIYKLADLQGENAEKLIERVLEIKGQDLLIEKKK